MPEKKPLLLRRLLHHVTPSKEKSNIKDDSHKQDGQAAPPAVPPRGIAESSITDGGISLTTTSSTTTVLAIKRLTSDAPASLPEALPTLNTALYTSSKGADLKAVAAWKATGDPVVDVAEDLAADGSLWDRAYNILKEEEPDRIAAYEDLLSRVLTIVQMKESPNPDKTTDIDEVTNQIPQHNAIARREKLKEIAELGLKHMEDKKISKTLLGHEIVLQDAVANVAGAVIWAEDYIKDAVKDLPYASIVLAGVSLVLPLLKNPAAVEAANQNGFIYVTSQMRYYAAMERLLLPEEMKSDLKADLTERLVNLYKLIISFQVRSVIRFYRNRTKNFFRGTINYDGWDKMLQDIKGGNNELILDFETAMSAITIDTLKNLARTAEASRNNLLIKVSEQLGVAQTHLGIVQKMDQHTSDVENQAALRDLWITNPRDDKKNIEQRKGGLLKDSYCWILSNTNFQQWRNDENSPLLWIKGDPGKGKTMLLCGIIDALEPTTSNTYDSLLSYFFCQATDLRANNATAVLRGLIFMLIDQQPLLISHLRKKYDSVGKKLFEDTNIWIALSEIFTNILQDPSLKRTYLIIDALDECLTNLPLLLDLIIQRSSTSPYIKWIVSSRNWQNIQERLESATQKVNLSLELNKKSMSDAISFYIQYKVDQLTLLKKYKDRTRNAIHQHLLLNANGTFLWVALVCQRLTEINRLKAIPELNLFPPGLDSLYKRMMENICDSEDVDLCKRILAVASMVYRPITLKELISLIDISEDISDDLELLGDIIHCCGSFLTIQDDTIYFIHQSAKDYLTNNEIASKLILPNGPASLHSDILSQSISAMSQVLRKDMYNLKSPGTSIQEAKYAGPDPLGSIRYACTYWADHLCEIYSYPDFQQLLSYNSNIDKFLRKHFLYWLEALSLIGSLPHGVVLICRLKDYLNSINSNTQLSALIHDAERFIRTFKDIIETAPLQAYCSALVFSPRKSLIRNLFQNDWPKWIRIPPKIAQVWSPCLQTLEGHTESVWSVVFSPNGQQLASASEDRTVRLWDATTGALQQMLEGHTERVRSVVFSPNGQQLASASFDLTVRLWDAATGVLQQTLEGHTESIWSVTFSPDSQQLASASEDQTVRLWDTATGALQQTLEGHTETVWSVVFSPDGQQLASASSDRTVRLWDAATGALQQMLEGHTESVRSVVFSPNGQQLASASSDRTVRLWDAATCALQQMLEGHTERVRSVMFSPNGQQLASASEDRTVRLWDAATGALQQMLEGHTGIFLLVAFSPDGQQLASASFDRTVRLWDTATGALQQKLEGHTRSVWSVAFSPDGQQLASASEDQTVRLWDVVTDALQQTLEGHTGRVWSVVFSPDGQQLASASEDQTIRLWDAATGGLQQTLEGHTESVWSVVFSPNGQQLASASEDQTVRLWDAATGALQQTLKGHTKNVWSVVFSPNGQQLASASFDRTVRLWDAATGALQQKLEGHTESIWSVVFSPNGQQLASASEDRTVRLWDATTGALQQMLEGHTERVRSVVFSPNGQQLASTSSDRTVRLWDATTGALQQMLEGHTKRVRSVVFSPNGQQLASTSGDRTVRLWDAATGALQQTFDSYTNLATFSPDGSNIIMDFGTFNTSHSAPQLNQSIKSTECAINWDNKWITWNGNNILWLPPEYRSVNVDIKKNCIGFGCATGVVYILSFNIDLIPFL